MTRKLFFFHGRTKTEKFREVIVFMHIPPFISSPDEEDLYSNLPKATRLMLLNEFADAGVKFVFAGHYHRNAGGFWRKSASDGDGEKKVENTLFSLVMYLCRPPQNLLGFAIK